MKVLVTGATGFIGQHLVRELKRKGYGVRVLLRKDSDTRGLASLDVEKVYGDILDIKTLGPAMHGCGIVFHAAGVFSYWGYSLEQLRVLVVHGTENVLNAAQAAKVKRIVLTSSSVVLGASYKAVSLTEKSPAPKLDDQPPYVLAKAEQEQVAFELAKKLGLQIVAVCPTLVVGGPDFKPTESNRMIVNYLKDPLKATWIGGCNIVSVEDVARGHVLAAVKGISGRRYILGGENLRWSQVHRILSELTGMPGPLVTANQTIAYLGASIQEAVSFFTKAAPAASRAQSIMVGQYYWYEHAPMKRLGYNPMSARQALAEATSWLVTSEHIPASVRSVMKLSNEIYEVRRDSPVKA
jgi:dihydroflavonol-4-reductase